MLKFLSSIVGSIFSLKFFISGGMMVILAIVLYNLAVEVIQEIMNFAIAQISGYSSTSVTSPTISGFAGWFLAQIKLPECFSVMVSAISIRFILRKIPFLHW